MSHSQPNTAPKQEDLTIARLELFSSQTKKVPFQILTFISVVAALTLSYVPAWVVMAWIAVMLTAYIPRWAIQLSYSKHFKGSLKNRITLLSWLAFATGMANASTVLFFPELPLIEKIIITMMLQTLAIGASATCAGYRPIMLPYVLCTMLSLALGWVTGAETPGYEWLNYLVTALICVLLLLILAIGRDSARLFLESFSIREQQIALNKQLDAALHREEDAHRAKTRFLASASHDLRQPLHTLALFHASLELQELPPQSETIVRHMDVALKLLSQQLDALLDISRLDADIIQTDITHVSWPTIVEHLKHTYPPLAAEKGLELEIAPAVNAMLKTDVTLLQRLIGNIVGNAIKYTNEGRIDISHTVTTQHLVLTIADTGHGIAENQQQNIFEEFYQIHNTERDHRQGLGLGLSIVKRLAQLLNIEIKLTSALGKGSTFHLFLPLWDHDADAAPITRSQSTLASRTQALHILVLDDEQEILIAMQSLLEGMQMSVALATNIDEAVEQAKIRQPDLLLSDLRLRHEENGIAAIQAIRTIYPKLPAALISGDTSPERLKQAQSAEIELLHKPLSGTDLQTAINKLTTTKFE